MNEPESYGPEGGHMGITHGGYRVLRQTEIDLEDTAARLARMEFVVEQARYALMGGDGPPDSTTAQLWLRTLLPPEHPNYVEPAELEQIDGNRDAEETRESEQ